jgi:hypothetical protein
MPWNETDIAFKKLNNKRITTNTGKGVNEERGASTININADEIWIDSIPGTPPVATTSVVEVYDYAARLTLIEDLSVPNQQAWFATTITNTVTANNGSNTSEAARLMDWIPDKYDAPGTVAGNGYEIKVYDKDDVLIPKGDASQWFFDYQTGILMFRNANTDSGTVSSRAPFKIVGYRYIGNKGAGSVSSVGGTNGIITDLLANAPITSTGNLQLDVAYSPTWTGLHTFSNSNAISLTATSGVHMSFGTSATAPTSIGQLVWDGTSFRTYNTQARTLLYGDFSNVSGILGLANGGTNANLTAVNGGVVYSTASGLGITSAGVANQVLISTGAGAPVWSNPSAVVSAGAGLTGTGTTPLVVALDTAYSPTWSGQHTFTYSPGSTAIGSNHAISVQGVPISVSNGALVEFGVSSAFNGTASAFTGDGSVNGGTYVAIAAASNFAGDFLHFGNTQASFSSRFRVTAAGLVIAATGYQVGNNRIIESILSNGGQAYGSVSGILNVKVTGNGFSSSASGSTLTLTLTNNITGSGTTNTIAMFTPSGSQVGNSSITQNAGGTQITLGASGAAVSIGSAGFSSNGTFNLPAATNTAGGIYFGTDAVIYRTGAGALRTNSSWTVDTTLSAGAGGFGVNAQGRLTIAPTTAGAAPIIIRSNATDDNSTSVNLLELQTSTGTAKLSVDSNGNLRSRTKSFDIPHPTKPNKRLVYGVLEGPEHGAYHRGEASGRGFVRVDLPEYWSALVHEDFTVILTSMCATPVRIVSKDAQGFVVAACGLFARWRTIRFAFHAEGSRRDADLIVEQDEIGSKTL